jgi:PIN domain nuclease of toxin-antitoxin system
VRLLLDSHALIWWLARSHRLSARARKAILDRRNTVLASAVSAYELVNKHRQGKLRPPLTDELLPMIRRAGLPLLAISFEHAVAAAELPGPHQDPWDRLLMGQARIDRLTMVSSDPVFADYGVPPLW